MNTTKVIFFYIFLIITIINSIIMYLGISLVNYTSIGMFLATLFVLVFCGLLTTVALASYRRVTLKTCFRFQILILLILVIASIVARVNEIFTISFDVNMAWRIGATVLYIILLLFTIGLSRDVFKKLVQINSTSK